MAARHEPEDLHANPTVDSVAISRIQAAFEASDRGKLGYRGALGDYNLYHLTRLVAQNPAELRFHTRRIFLCIHARKRLALIGALIDLLLVLRGRGAPLYHRLLEQSKPVIGAAVHERLEAAFRQDDVRAALRLPTEQSVLANGYSGQLFPAAAAAGERM